MDISDLDNEWKLMMENDFSSSPYLMKPFRDNQNVCLGIKKISPNNIQKGIILKLDRNTKEQPVPELNSFNLNYDFVNGAHLIWWGLNDEKFYEYFKSMAFHVAYETDAEFEEKKRLSIFLFHIKSWQEFLQDKNSKPTRSHTIGLFGEISYINYLIDNDIADIETVINAWHKGGDPKRDFYFQKGAIEIKTTTQNIPKHIHIGNLKQLDETTTANLFLGVVILNESDSSGLHLDELILQTMNKIKDTYPHLLEKFRKKLLNEKCLYEIKDYYKKWKFSLYKIETFHVKDDFPRLKPSDIADLSRNGIVETKYEIQYGILMPFKIEKEKIKQIV